MWIMEWRTIGLGNTVGPVCDEMWRCNFSCFPLGMQSVTFCRTWKIDIVNLEGWVFESDQSQRSFVPNMVKMALMRSMYINEGNTTSRRFEFQQTADIDISGRAYKKRT